MSARYTVIAPAGDNNLQRFATDLNALLARVQIDIMPPYLTVSQLPTDGSKRLAIVTDETGGEVLAFFTSALEWRRVTDRAVCA